MHISSRTVEEHVQAKFLRDLKEGIVLPVVFASLILSCRLFWSL